jgi:hypothetical protein
MPESDQENLEAELTKLAANIPESAQTVWQNATVVKGLSLLGLTIVRLDKTNARLSKVNITLAYDIVGQSQPYCLPDEVTHGQMMRVLIKFIKDHPEKAHFKTGVLEVESFMDAFPCKQPSKKR